jgi:hypothetical protein
VLCRSRGDVVLRGEAIYGGTEQRKPRGATSEGRSCAVMVEEGASVGNQCRRKEQTAANADAVGEPWV